MEKDVVIVGDGIQGTGVALGIADALGMDNIHDKLMVVGDQGYLGNWERFTKAQGMTRLISPNDVQVGSAVASYSDVLPEPSVEEFCANAQSLIEKYKIDTCHHLGRVSDLEQRPGLERPFGIKVSSIQEIVRTKVLILALGRGCLNGPSEFLELAQRHPHKVMHTHNIPADMDWSNKNVLIYGIGRSAVTLREHIFESGGQASIASRSVPRSSKIYYPTFTDVTNVEAFRLKPLKERLEILKEFYANTAPSFSPDEEIPTPPGIYLHHEITGVSITDDKTQVQLHDTSKDKHLTGEFDVVVLATGYSDFPMDLSLIPKETEFIEFLGGVYPSMDEYLQINGIPGLFGLGHLSLLRQGAAAKDIPAIPSHVHAIMGSNIMQGILHN